MVPASAGKQRYVQLLFFVEKSYKGGRRKGHTLVFNNGLPLATWPVYVSILHCEVHLMRSK